MSIIDIFSKRGKRRPVTIQHSELPHPLRVQIVRILDGAIARTIPPLAREMGRGEQVYRQMHDALAHEKGLVRLPSPDDARLVDAATRVQVFIQSAPTDDVLDLIEVALHIIGEYARRKHHTAPHSAVSQDVDELNRRFREHGVGYRIERLKVVKIGSDLLHEEAVKLAVAVLRGPGYAGADAEFGKALGCFRHGQYEDAITECHKALESTLKVICERRGWPFDAEKTTAKQLLDIVFREGLIPSYLQDQFGGLRSVLGGISTTRNRSGGHGAGAKPRKVPEHLAAYVVHQTAAAILYLAESEKRMGR